MGLTRQLSQVCQLMQWCVFYNWWLLFSSSLCPFLDKCLIQHTCTHTLISGNKFDPTHIHPHPHRDTHTHTHGLVVEQVVESLVSFTDTFSHKSDSISSISLSSIHVHSSYNLTARLSSAIISMNDGQSCSSVRKQQQKLIRSGLKELWYYDCSLDQMFH